MTAKIAGTFRLVLVLFGAVAARDAQGMATASNEVLRVESLMPQGGQGADSTLLIRPVTLDVKNKPLGDVLSDINRQVEGRLTYDATLIAGNPSRVTYKGKGVPLHRVLDAVLAGTGIEVLLSESGRTIVLKQNTDSTEHVLRGRVISADNLPISKAMVSVAASGRRFMAQTDSAGRFAVTVNVPGPYEASVLRIGFVRQTVIVPPTRERIVLVKDVIMRQLAQRLSAIHTKGEQEDDGSPSSELWSNRDVVGEAEQDNGATVFSSRSDVESLMDRYMVRSMPLVTMNGLPFLGNYLPSTGLFVGEVHLGGSDLGLLSARSGALDVRANSGSTAEWSRVDFMFIDPSLGWAAPASRQIVNSPSHYRIHGDFEVQSQSMIISYWLDQSITPVRSLLGDDEKALRGLGVSRDSLARFVDILRSETIPFGNTTRPTVLTRAGAMVYKGVPEHWSTIAYLSFDRSNGAGVRPDAMPSVGQTRAGDKGFIQTMVERSLGRRFRNVSVAQVGFEKSSAQPDLVLPAARVLVASNFPDTASGLATIEAAGGSARADSRGIQADFLDVLYWHTFQKRHRQKLTLRLNAKRSEQYLLPNAFGTYTFNSLADFQQRLPAAFTRVLGTAGGKYGSLTSEGSYTDNWRVYPTVKVRLSGGLEITRYSIATRRDAVAESLFAIRTDRLPREGGFEAAGGIDWTYRTLAHGRSAGTLSVAINHRRDPLEASSLASVALGRHSEDVRQIACFGSAAPRPEWADYLQSASSIPTSCVGGDQKANLQSISPLSSAFATGFRAPTYTELVVGWHPMFPGLPKASQRTHIDLEALYRYVDHLGDPVDRNLANVPQFTLPGEGARAVFVPATTIVPTSGVVPWIAARVSDRYGIVNEFHSSARRDERQVRLNVQPGFPNWGTAWITYVYTRSSERARGFQGTTGGNPFVAELVPGADDRAQDVMVTGGARIPGGYWVQPVLRIASGERFTPMVAADINGDGRANDRAFVFAHNDPFDPASAAAIDSLFDRGSSSVRQCLGHSLGRIAAPNSCRGPVHVTFDVQIATKMPFFTAQPGTASRSGSFLFATQNLLVGLDRLFHGPKRLHGWGQSGFVDPYLMTPVGFDPTTQRFKYLVNPRFGEAYRTVFAPPFQVVVSGEIRLSHDDRAETFRYYFGTDSMGVGHRKTYNDHYADLRRFAAIRDLYAYVLSVRDSLLLSDAQVDTLRKLDAGYRHSLDSAAIAPAQELAALQPPFNLKVVYARMREYGQACQHFRNAAAYRLRDILTDEQWDQIPADYMGWIPRALGGTVDE